MVDRPGRQDASRACDEVEHDLPDAARIVREGQDVAAHHPALARHLEECEWCRATLDELVREPDVAAEADVDVDPRELGEQALALALRSPEAIVRLRHIERVGATEQVGAGVLPALARVASEDPDTEVRSAALTALEAVLTRLARDERNPAVAEATGRLSVEEGELRLLLENLPASFEQSRPVLAVPAALRSTAPPIQWSGREPGLVRTDTPVAEGRLQALLGRIAEPTVEEEAARALERIFLLKPER